VFSKPETSLIRIKPRPATAGSLLATLATLCRQFLVAVESNILDVNEVGEIEGFNPRAATS
jgi:hypothetical protein